MCYQAFLSSAFHVALAFCKQLWPRWIQSDAQDGLCRSHIWCSEKATSVKDTDFSIAGAIQKRVGDYSPKFISFILIPLSWRTFDGEWESGVTAVPPLFCRWGLGQGGESWCSSSVTGGSVASSNCHTSCVSVNQAKSPPLQLPHFLSLGVLDILGCHSKISQVRWLK